MTSVFSHSRLSSFEDCPRKFQYRYVLKIPSDTDGIEAFVGRRVHEVLERLYEVATRGRVPSLPKVIARYQQLFDDAYDPEKVRIVRRENPLHFYRDLGEHCLANYYHEHYPFDGDETLATEEHLVFELGTLDGETVKIQGFVDRIARARDGTIEIQDYKTGARVPSQAKLDQDRQLALYQMGLRERFGGERPYRLVWHFLQRGQTRTSTRTPEQLEDLRHETLALVTRIGEEKTFAPRAGPLCRWCEYSERCPGSPQRNPDLATWEETLPLTPPRPRRPGERAPARPSHPAQLPLFDAPSVNADS